MSAKIISISNFKGGVGKSTTAVNLSAALTRFRKKEDKEKIKVLILDLDPQCNTSIHLHPTGELDKAISVSEVFFGKNLIEAITETTTNNLHLVPAKIKMFKDEYEILSSARAINGLKKCINDSSVKEEYDFIIIDTPPNLGTYMINALVASDYYIIPVEAESFYALYGLEILLGRITEIIDYSNKDLKALGYLTTKYDGRQKASKIMRDKILKTYGDVVFKTIIRTNTDLSKSSLLRKTIFQYDPRTNGASDYLDFAKEVLDKLNIAVIEKKQEDEIGELTEANIEPELTKEEVLV